MSDHRSAQPATVSSATPRAQSLVLGLDGADLGVVQSLGPKCLPHLHRLMQKGAYAAVQSVQPPATLPNWLTFLTGTDPGMHGVFDFTTRRGYEVEFTAGSVRGTSTVAARLDRLGLTCACVGFPGTWPPEKLRHGVFVSGWDSPVAFESDSSFVWPEALYGQMVARFGRQRFDVVDEFNATADGWHRRLPGALAARIERRADMAEWLLCSRHWDLFALYFGELDTASHHLWALHDPASPRHPAQTGAAERAGLSQVYRSLDAAVGRLVACAGGDAVEVTVVSDHGSGGASDKVLYLNRFLQEAGLLRLRPRSTLAGLSAAAKRAALPLLTPKTREKLFRLGRNALANWLESRTRFSAIDMARTTVFSDELNYFPAIHFNLRGREPQGTLDQRDTPKARRDLEEALFSLRDPWTGEPVVRAVCAREELYRGPFVHRAPDLLIEFHCSHGYSYNLMPSVGGPLTKMSRHSAGPAGTSAESDPCVHAPTTNGIWRRLMPQEYLGRKGCCLSGSHRARGLFIAAGPAVKPAGRVHAHIADTTVTLLARMKVAPPADLVGRVLEPILHKGAYRQALPDAERPQAPGDKADQTRVQARLRALGYIE